LNQLFYELKHFDYILKEIQVLKNKLYEPKLSPELFDTFNAARLDFQKHYYIKTQLMDALRKIKPEQGEVSSSQEVIIQKIVNNVYETEEFQIFCFNCCNVCHKSCQLSDSSASDRKFLKKCASMIQNEKKCGVCIRKCSYKSHYRINKIIVQEVESYSIEPTETQIKEAIQLEENEIGKIIQDINQASLVPYFIVELQRIVSLTFSNLEDCEENKLKEIFKMEMSALSGFRYLLATS
jgi:competence protein ComGF